MNFIFLDSLLVVVGGAYGNVLDDIELIDVEGLGVNCEKPPDLPNRIYGHVSAVIQDMLTVCGGSFVVLKIS